MLGMKSKGETWLVDMEGNLEGSNVMHVYLIVIVYNHDLSSSHMKR